MTTTEKEHAQDLFEKPWRGFCPVCWWMVWCTDTEAEAATEVQAHIDAEHRMAPIVRLRARAGVSSPDLSRDADPPTDQSIGPFTRETSP